MALAADYRSVAFVDSDRALELLGGRLREVHAILLAIEAGELLSDLPADQSASERHAIGLSLLEVISRELSGLIDQLDELGQPVEDSHSIN